MFGIRKVALAAAVAASGLLWLSPVPAGAQALRLGLADQAVHGAGVEQVQWHGRPRGAYRGPAMRGGYPARMAGPRYMGPRYAGPRYGGPRYAGPRYMGPRYVAPRYVQGGPRWGNPGWGPPPGAWGPGRWYPGRGWWRPNYGWGYYDNSGAWIALGVASGLALGAAVAAQPTYVEPVYPAGDAVAYCAQRYRSYNVRTGTYTGYDGLQHPCP